MEIEKVTPSQFQIVVLAKQVPDTHDVGKEAMNADGTVNRAALPTIFNPEDLNALEMALQVRDQVPGASVFVLTMGPANAADILREALYRGADDGAVLSDRRFAGSDTLATSYALSCAINRIPNVKLVFCGRQAIDGDTAQVGPQVAEKLNMQQLTYAEHLIEVSSDAICVGRRIESGSEVVSTPLPALVTVTGSACESRPRNAHRLLSYCAGKTPSEAAADMPAMESVWQCRPYLKLKEWNADDIQPDMVRLGSSGSATKVKQIENVAITKREAINVKPCQCEIDSMMRDLASFAF